MKFILSALMLVASLQSFASDRGFDVSVIEKEDTIQLRFATKQIHSSMCFLRNDEVNIHSVGATSPITPVEPTAGSIEVSASVAPMTPCLTAFGPHRGEITFAKGRNLPALAVGSYEVVINGENVGNLVVSQLGARLE